MQILQLLTSIAVLIGATQAHTRIISMNSDTTCVRTSPSSPILDLASNDMICHENGAIPAPTVCSVAPNSMATLAWDPAATLHMGCVIIYMAKVDDAKTTTITDLSWFKIYQSGLVGSLWASDTVNANGGTLEFKIPSNIAPGDYLLRGETIGIHAAYTYPGAQFYMSCIQINVSGSGTISPPGVSFPGAYSPTDPGIVVNVYNTGVINYTIPGPTTVVT